MLVTAVASSGQNLPPVTTSPSGASDPSAANTSSQFKDVYHTSQKSDDESESDQGESDPKNSGLKKRPASDSKTDQTVPVAVTGQAQTKTPLLFSLPSLGALAVNASNEGTETEADSKSALIPEEGATEVAARQAITPPPVPMTPRLGSM